MKFTVDRKTWYRGNGPKESRLLRVDGMRCCLGHVGKQCGIVDEELLSKSVPPDVNNSVSKFPQWLQEPYRRPREDVSDMGNATDINDEETFSDVVRESKLKAIFAKNGDELEFIN